MESRVTDLPLPPDAEGSVTTPRSQSSYQWFPGHRDREGRGRRACHTEQANGCLGRDDEL